MRSVQFALFDTTIGGCGIVWHDGGILGVQLAEASETSTRARIAKRFPTASHTLPGGSIGDAILGIVQLLGGARVDLAGVALDMSEIPAFARAVYEVARNIPPGSVRTYAQVGAAAEATLRAESRGAPRFLSAEGDRLRCANDVDDNADGAPLAGSDRAGASVVDRVGDRGPLAIGAAGDPLRARAVGAALGANPYAIIVPCHRVVAAGGKLGGFSANGGRITKRRLLEIEKARFGDEPDLFDTMPPR